MTLEDCTIQICMQSGLGLNPAQYKDMISLGIRTILEEMDALVPWRCSIEPFTNTVLINKNSVTVSNINLFKPIICKVVDADGGERPLTFREMTDFDRIDAEFGTGTNDYPSIYTLGAGRIWIGPGIMDSNKTITGKVRRRLTLNDIDQLPAPMVIYGTSKLIAKKGSPESIAAWNGWNNSKQTIVTASSKKTGEERDTQPLDPVIERNLDYLSTL